VILPLHSHAFLFFIPALLALAFTTHAQAESNVTVTDEVLLSAPPRLGVNIGESKPLNDNDILVNALLHGGFRKGRHVRIIEAANPSNGAIFDANHNPNIWTDGNGIIGGTMTVLTGAAAGRSAAITGHSADGRIEFAPEDFSLDPGDYIAVHGPLQQVAKPERELGDTYLGIGRFHVKGERGSVVDLIDDPGDPGDQLLQITLADVIRAQGGVAHDVFVEPDSEYICTVRARGTPGLDLVTAFFHTRLARNDPRARIETFPRRAAVSGELRAYTTHISTPSVEVMGEGPCRLEVFFTAGETPGGVGEIDSIVFTQPEQQTPSGVKKRVVDHLKDSRVGVLRFHRSAAIGGLVEDITAPNPTQASWTYYAKYKDYEGQWASGTVDQWMLLAEETGAIPWIPVGAPNTPDDWYNLISYLAAPPDFDDYAQKRANHGYEQPWTDRAPTIYLECGNEWWNPTFAPFHIKSPQKMAEVFETVFKAARNHPHFDDDCIKLVAGAWAANAYNWTVPLARELKSHDAIAVAPYLLHSLDTHEPLQSRYQALFAATESYTRVAGRMAIDAATKPLAVYELNTHLTDPNVPKKSAGELATSVGAGIAVLDTAMTAMANLGASPVALFQLFQRDFGGRLGLWGTSVRLPSGKIRPRPVWLGLELANRYFLTGDILQTDVTGSPTWTQPKNGTVNALENVPYIKAYAARHDNGVNVMIVNRHLEQTLPVKIDLPVDATSNVNLALLTSDAIIDNNEQSQTVTIKQSNLTDFSGIYRAPPYSASVLQFRNTP